MPLCISNYMCLCLHIDIIIYGKKILILNNPYIIDIDRTDSKTEIYSA